MDGDDPRVEETAADHLDEGVDLSPTVASPSDLETTLGKSRQGGAEVESTLAAETIVREGTNLQITTSLHESPARLGRGLPTIPGYEVEAEIGRGGMGVVYRARSVRLNRVVALKMILAGDHAGVEASLRFLAEAEAIARIQHPNIVQIFHIDEHQGRPYFEMEYLGGGSLADRLDGQPRPPRVAAKFVAQLTRAVVEAHRMGIVHRDLKPANILLTVDDVAKVADFGLAKRLSDNSGLTRTDSILGSPSYMAPEQAEGKTKDVGESADVYSLGAILYEQLTGRPPFVGATVLDTLQQVKLVEPVPPSRLVPGIPRDIETIALKCLDKTPSRRYASASELADDLGRFVDNSPILARPISVQERAVKWVRRKPALAAMIGAVQILLIALLATIAWSYSRVSDALSIAEYRRGLAEMSGSKEATARADAEKARNAALDETSRALLSETRALRLSREAGWRGEAVKNLTRLAALDTPSRDIVRLRTEAVATLGEVDARPIAQFGSGALGAWRVEFHQDGRTLAVNDDQQGVVHLWDTKDNRLIRKITKASGFAPFAFRPDGSVLAFGAPGSQVGFEPIKAGNQPPKPLIGQASALALSFSKTGDRIAVAWGAVNGSQSVPIQIHSVIVYQVDTGQVLRKIEGPFDPINFKTPLVIAPDGLSVAAMGPDHEVRIWKVAGNEKPLSLGRHRSQVLCMAYSPDGETLATTGRTPEPVVRLWDVAEGRERLALHGHSSNVWGVAFSPDGLTLASTGNDLTLRFWDPQNGQQRLNVNTGTGAICLSMAFDGDGKRVAVGGNHVRLIELEGFDAKKNLSGHDNVAYTLAFRPGRAELATGSLDGKLIVWNLAQGTQQTYVSEDLTYPHRVIYSPNGESLLIGPSGGRPGTSLENSTYFVRLVNFNARGNLVRLTGPRITIRSLAIDRSGKWAAAGLDDGQAFVWEIETRQTVAKSKLGRPVTFIGFLNPKATNGSPTVFAATDVGEVMLIELDGNVPIGSKIPGNPSVFAISKDGERLATGSPDGSIRILRLPDLVLLAEGGISHSGAVNVLAFYPDGGLLASAGSDRRVIIHDGKTLARRFEIGAPMAFVNALAFSSDGTYLAFTGSSENVAVWNLGQILSGLNTIGLGLDSRPLDKSAGGIELAAHPALLPSKSTILLAPKFRPSADPVQSLKTKGQFLEAANELDRWIERFPDDLDAYVDAAGLRVMSNDTIGYERHRRRMLAQFGKTQDPSIAERTSKACLLRPGESTVIQEAARLARLSQTRAAEAAWFPNYFDLAAAMGRFREGEITLAETDLRAALKSKGNLPWNVSIPGHYLMAIVRGRQGRWAEARAEFALAESLQTHMPRPTFQIRDDDGHDQRICEIYHREAEQFLFDTAFPSDPFAK